MARLTTVWGPPRELERAWPEVLSTGDPLAGDELVYDPSPHADYRARVPGGDLDAPAHRRWDRAFHEAYVAVLEGRAAWGATDAAAAALGVDAPLKLDRRRATPAGVPLDDPTLCDLCEDWVPDVAVLLERVLGPFAAVRPPRRARVAAGAVMAFSPLLHPRVRPLARGLRNRPKPPPEVRQAIQTVMLAPAMAYAQDAGRLTPLLPQGARFSPTAPLRPAPAAPVLLGRAVPLQAGGTWLAAALPLPGAPPTPVLRRRVVLEYQRLRRHERRLTLEDLLRERPEVLYRAACEWWFEHDPDAVLACWAAPSSWPVPPASASSAAGTPSTAP